MKQFFLAILSFLAAVLIVLLFVALGWYLLWVLIIKRFKFIKDILNSAKGLKEPSKEDLQTVKPKTKKTRKD